MEEDPHQVLEGIIIACYATRATTAYLYLRYEYGRSYRALQAGDRRVLRRQPARQEHPRQAISTSTSTCIAGPGRTSAARRPG